MGSSKHVGRLLRQACVGSTGLVEHVAGPFAKTMFARVNSIKLKSAFNLEPSQDNVTRADWTLFCAMVVAAKEPNAALSMILMCARLDSMLQVSPAPTCSN